MNFIKASHERKERNKYLELKLDEVCKKVEIMTRPKPCTPRNTDVVPSNKINAMV